MDLAVYMIAATFVVFFTGALFALAWSLADGQSRDFRFDASVPPRCVVLARLPGFVWRPLGLGQWRRQLAGQPALAFLLKKPALQRSELVSQLGELLFLGRGIRLPAAVVLVVGRGQRLVPRFYGMEG